MDVPVRVSPLPSPAKHLTDEWHSAYLQKLLKWFEQHQRDLPWRKTRDPYAIWISESMLQQTQVATVIAYYHRFMQRFPDVATLAAASEQEVMSMWAGLGYYRRARQLHAAAKQIVADHNGTFPARVESILKLQGIGRYTAGAIASIALGLPAPIVEANTERLYARLLKLEKPVREPAATRLLWEFAEWQLAGTTTSQKSSKKRGPGAVNQAVMELGALICKPVNPQCLICPLVELCPTARDGLQQRIPVPKPKREFTALHHIALLVRHRGRWLLRQYPAGGWWHGLWDFPRVDVTELRLHDQVAAKSKMRDKLGFNEDARRRILKLAHQQLLADNSLEVFTALHEPLMSMSHGVTRYRIALEGITAEVVPTFFKGNHQWKWVDAEAGQELPLTATAKKMLKRVAEYGG